MRVRLARSGDAAAFLDIYAPIVRDTVVSFEYEPPEVSELAARIERVLERFPWLVAEEGDTVLGYAYAVPFRGRIAYSWSAETSVYVADHARRRGIGRHLMRLLLAGLRAQGHHMVQAGITLPNPASVLLHEQLGFQPIGVVHEAGFKHGSWHDVGLWELRLSDFEVRPDAFPVPVAELLEPPWEA